MLEKCKMDKRVACANLNLFKIIHALSCSQSIIQGLVCRIVKADSAWNAPNGSANKHCILAKKACFEMGTYEPLCIKIKFLDVVFCLDPRSVYITTNDVSSTDVPLDQGTGLWPPRSHWELWNYKMFLIIKLIYKGKRGAWNHSR